MSCKLLFVRWQANFTETNKQTLLVIVAFGVQATIISGYLWLVSRLPSTVTSD